MFTDLMWVQFGFIMLAMVIAMSVPVIGFYIQKKMNKKAIRGKESERRDYKSLFSFFYDEDRTLK